MVTKRSQILSRVTSLCDLCQQDSSVTLYPVCIVSVYNKIFVIVTYRGHRMVSRHSGVNRTLVLPPHGMQVHLPQPPSHRTRVESGVRGLSSRG